MDGHFDATELFHFKERHCLKKVLYKGTENEWAVYFHHVLEAKLVLEDGFAVSSGMERNSLKMKMGTNPKMTVRQRHSNGWHFLVCYKDGSILSELELE